MSDSEKTNSNIKRLPLIEQIGMKLNLLDILSVFKRESHRPDSTITYSPNDVQKRSYEELSRLSSVELTPLFDEQVSNLQKGAEDISKVLNSIPDEIKEEENKSTDIKTQISENVELGNIHVSDEKQAEKSKDEDEMEL